MYKSQQSVLMVMLLLLLVGSASSAAEHQISVTQNDDGSVTIETDLSAEDLGEHIDNHLNTAKDIGLAMRQAFADDLKIDYSQAHVVEGQFQVSVSRPNGSIGLYPLTGKVYAFDRQSTFTETAANYSLSGVILFQHKGKFTAESGTISLIKKN